MGEGALTEEGRRFFGPGAREGEVIAGRYRVVREIGAGGMGQVVEVEHLELEKRFALKLIRPDRWDTTLEARFRRE
ncbi:MAG: serine/threonine protein kinase, partial [Sandaracinaceae bacterium]|nr:serine/threonine protein kinase [Sandaracinaceae bacterium]